MSTTTTNFVTTPTPSGGVEKTRQSRMQWVSMDGNSEKKKKLIDNIFSKVKTIRSQFIQNQRLHGNGNNGNNYSTNGNDINNSNTKQLGIQLISSEISHQIQDLAAFGSPLQTSEFYNSPPSSRDKRAHQHQHQHQHQQQYRQSKTKPKSPSGGLSEPFQLSREEMRMEKDDKGEEEEEEQDNNMVMNMNDCSGVFETEDFLHAMNASDASSTSSMFDEEELIQILGYENYQEIMCRIEEEIHADAVAEEEFVCHDNSFGEEEEELCNESFEVDQVLCPNCSLHALELFEHEGVNVLVCGDCGLRVALTNSMTGASIAVANFKEMLGNIFDQ